MKKVLFILFFLLCNFAYADVASKNPILQDEGTTVAGSGRILNFTGAGVAVTFAGGKYVITIGGGGSVEDDVYSSGWNGDTTNAPSQNAVYDRIHLYDTDDDGDIDNIDGAVGGGDITKVGDAAVGDVFDGTSGTTLIFNNAGGDGTLLYNSEFSFNQNLGIGITNPTAALDVVGNIVVSGTVDGVDISARDHNAVTVTDTATIDMTLATQDVKGDVIANKDIVAGVGLSGGEDNVLPGADADTTLTFDATELDDLTWDAGTLTKITWTWNTDTTDPTMTFENSGMIGIGTTDPTTALDVVGTVNATALTEGGNAVYNSTETPGGSLGGTWASPTIDDLFLLLGGDVATAGTYDFGSASVVLEIPNAAAPITDATGEIAIDTNLITQGMLQVYLTSAIANIVATTDTPGDNEVPTYDAVGGTIQWEAGGAGSGDITSVGDVADGAAFDGTQGTTLTFNNAGGDGTLLYDATNAEFSFNKNLGIGTTNPGSALDVIGTAEADTLTESGNAVYNSTEVPGGELGGTFASFTIDDSVAVTSWNLTTPTITTSATMTDGATLGQAAGPLVAFDDTNNFLEITGSNVGIGTTNPGATLEIVGSMIIPNGAADATLSTAGQIHVNTTDEQLSIHSAADGEISGEVSISAIRHLTASFDPDAVCDGAVDRVFLFTVGDDAPEGIIIDEWKVSFEADPTTEVDLDLKYADAFIGVANAAVIDVLDTLSGVSSEDTDANINGGAAVANGKVVYLEFGTAYTETTHQIIFECWFHNLES